MFYFSNFFHFNFFMVPPHLYPDNQQVSFLFNQHVNIAMFLNHSSPHIKNTQLIYNNTNNKNIFYHYIFHKTYTHTILISSKHVFNQAYYILPKLAIDLKGNKSSTSDYCFKPNGQTTYHRFVCIIYLKIIMIQWLNLPRSE